jgi:hypothetical protein
VVGVLRRRSTWGCPRPGRPRWVLQHPPGLVGAAEGAQVVGQDVRRGAGLRVVGDQPPPVEVVGVLEQCARGLLLAARPQEARRPVLARLQQVSDLTQERVYPDPGVDPGYRKPVDPRGPCPVVAAHAFPRVDQKRRARSIAPSASRPEGCAHTAAAEVASGRGRLFGGYHRPQPHPNEGRLAAPGRGPSPAIALLRPARPAPATRGELLHLMGPSEEGAVHIGCGRTQAREWRTAIGPARPPSISNRRNAAASCASAMTTSLTMSTCCTPCSNGWITSGSAYRGSSLLPRDCATPTSAEHHRGAGGQVPHPHRASPAAGDRDPAPVRQHQRRHRVVRRGPGGHGDRGGQDPATVPAGELLRRRLVVTVHSEVTVRR